MINWFQFSEYRLNSFCANKQEEIRRRTDQYNSVKIFLYRIVIYCDV